MRITEIQGTNMDITDAIRTYITEKLESIERFTKRFDPCDVAVEVGKTSEHHNKGDIYFAEFDVIIPGDHLRSRVELHDLYAAIDGAKDDVKRQLIDAKEKMVRSRVTESPADFVDENLVEEEVEEEIFDDNDSLE